MREGWRATTLREVVETLDARAGSGGPDLVLSVTEKRGIIPQTDVFNKRIATVDVAEYKVLEPLDIAFNPYLLWTGAIGQWKGTKPGITSPVYECFRVCGDNSARFVGLILESGQLTPYFDSTAIGSIQRRRRTTHRVFMDAPIVLPPLNEQRRIVDLIAAVDEAIVATEGVSHSANGAGTAYEDDITAAMHEVGVVELGMIADVAGGITKDGKRQSDPSYVEVPYLRVANVQRGFLDLNEVTTIRVPPEKARSLFLQSGDVLLNEGGDRDKLGRGWIWENQVHDCIHQNHVFRARLTSDRFNPYFVAILANSRFGQRWFEEHGSQTTNLASINLKTLRKFPISTTTRREQDRLVETYFRIRDTAMAAERMAQAFRSLRSALLADLLSGDHEISTSYDQLLST